ncbi:MAG: ABC transporter ATP-binding protein, partial [Paracoccaceae bacterium]
PELRRRIGVVFQDFRLLNHLSAFDNVALPLRVSGVRETEVEKNVVELLTWVGLKEHINARPPTLSGGQQQRVAIARVLAARPRLVLADEPTGNLDEDTAKVVLDEMLGLVAQTGAALMVVTHSDAVAGRMQRRVHLRSGQLA